MPKVTGSVLSRGTVAANAYVQLRNKDGDFCGEVHADDEGHFVLYAVPGHWQLVSWLPGDGFCKQEVEIVLGDVDVNVPLAG
jgi:hypothetical protein